MPGHLFILQGDIKKLSSDAWLVSRDSKRSVGTYWGKGLLAPVEPTFPPDWGDPGGPRTFPWTNWSPDWGPEPWLTNAATGGGDISWLVSGALEFLDKASRAVLARGHYRARRAVPLLALPVIGTRSGGAARVKGGVVSQLVPALLEWVSRNPVDVALVCRSPQMLAACQHVRGAVGCNETVTDLARLATQGQLSLFLGAGISTGAGLPTWDELISALCGQAGIAPASLKGLNNLDQAQVLSLQLGTRFRDLICAEVSSPYYSLSHGLLAGLRIHETITQNYDCLIEAAWKEAGQTLSVLPHKPLAGHPWLLKMHGCATKAESIILTRQDYLRYGDRNAALAGMVQGALLTRHLLFYGFSLRDDNFIGIVDAVRKARVIPGTFGTVLMANPPEYLHQLWGQDLRIVAVPDYRELEIQLDHLLSRTHLTAGYLLDPNFQTLLSPAEEKLREALLNLQRLPEAVQNLPAWTRVAELLSSFGSPGG